MTISRRSLLGAGGWLALEPLGLRAAPKLAGLRIGVTDWNLRQTGKVEAVALAKSLGFDGVQLSIGRKPVDGKLPLDNAGLQAQYVREAKAQHIALDGTCLDILHDNYLKSDKLARKWVADSIPITKNLGVEVVLLPFFGKAALATPQEREYVGDVLKELAPEAQRAGVVLGLEDTISAEDNVRIMDRAGSRAVSVYYDIGNSTNNGFDAVKEIRWLGKDRICQIHLKDKGYLGEGRIDLRAVMQAIADIGFTGFANLETSSPSGDIPQDMRRNLKTVRTLIQQVQEA